MKNKLEFFDSLGLYLVAVLTFDIIALGLLYVFIKFFDPTDPAWWLSVILIYGDAIAMTVGLYPRCMSKIYLTPEGIEKKLFKNLNKQSFIWDEIKDCQIITRPNGYSYIVVSDEPIKRTSFSDSLKNKKHCICFTYNKEALEYINNQLKTEKLK